MGAGGIIVIGKAVKSALQVGVTRSGNFKLWHILVVTHALCWAAGKWL
jgi:hypothetical protein